MSNVNSANMETNDEVMETSDCPVPNFVIIREFWYWVDGVILFCVGMVGLLLNLAAVYILASRKAMRNMFNNLLISLFCFDSLYLMLMLISSFHYFASEERTEIEIVLFPYLTYPMSSITLTASIFMTVGVAHERYSAIKHPIRHRQSLRSASFRRKRLWAYILSVIACSFIFNVPKFMDLKITWRNSTETQQNVSENR